jgi:hypothetical protein
MGVSRMHADISSCAHMQLTLGGFAIMAAAALLAMLAEVLIDPAHGRDRGVGGRGGDVAVGEKGTVAGEPGTTTAPGAVVEPRPVATNV